LKVKNNHSSSEELLTRSEFTKKLSWIDESSRDGKGGFLGLWVFGVFLG